MLVPRPGYTPLVQIDVANSFGYMADLGQMSVGVGVFGSAAAYALVWELGRTDINPGPKTLWSTNRLGERVVLTKQAPHGYVGVNQKQAMKILKQALNGVTFNFKDLNRSKLDLEVALDNAAQKIAGLIAEDAPVDTGDLRSQIQLISSDETDLLDLDEDSGALML